MGHGGFRIVYLWCGCVRSNILWIVWCGSWFRMVLLWYGVYVLLCLWCICSSIHVRLYLLGMRRGVRYDGYRVINVLCVRCDVGCIACVGRQLELPMSVIVRYYTVKSPVLPTGYIRESETRLNDIFLV